MTGRPEMRRAAAPPGRAGGERSGGGEFNQDRSYGGNAGMNAAPQRARVAEAELDDEIPF